MNFTKSYELTDEVLYHNGHVLYRIKEIRDIPYHHIKKGTLGGFIESENNLLINGWVADYAMVYEGAVVTDNAYVGERAEVYGNSVVRGNSVVCGNSKIFDAHIVSSNCIISGEVILRGTSETNSENDFVVYRDRNFNILTYDRVAKKWSLNNFYATSEELLKFVSFESERYKMNISLIIEEAEEQD